MLKEQKFRHLFLLTISLIFCFHQVGFSQPAPPTDWYHYESNSSKYNGIGIDKLYQYELKNKPSQTVIVAVLDTGVDIDHEDLEGKIWVNRDEIPGNKIDDDQNGYVDDIHGWNFIGAKDGTNVTKETLEVTRLYGKLRKKYGEVDVSKLNKKEKAEYKQFQSYRDTVEKRRKGAQKKVREVEEQEQWVMNALTTAEKKVGNAEINTMLVDKLMAFDAPEIVLAGKILSSIIEQGADDLKLGELIQLIAADFEALKEPYLSELEYRFNPDFNSREIIGDDYDNPNDRDYGNNDVQGAYDFHGTHVAGIIGAQRDNDIGMNGIVENVEIMCVRMLPDGDEHDKDVANAIRYAVDNGASVINMSFGKGQSWDKKTVDDAVKYALKKDVLLIHAAGNSGMENDGKNNYPNSNFEKRGLFGPKKAKNWIEVGALSYKKGQNSIAGFSNYSETLVDLFAPGEAIYSTAPGDQYQFAQGTSMAAPVVAGTAALIRSYYPGLSAVQVKDILMESSTKLKEKVLKPGTFERVGLSELSVSGGMLDAYAAMQLAANTKGKSKKKSKSDKLRA